MAFPLSGLLLAPVLFSTAFAGGSPRIVVVDSDGSVDAHLSKGLQRKLRAATDRPNATIHPGRDLYQAGRAEAAPVDLEAVNSATARIAQIPWNALSEQDWVKEAENLQAFADPLWFLDGPELRKPAFDLYVQIGRAAENASNPVEPYYGAVGNKTLNLYWYYAATLAHEEPGLLDDLNDELRPSIEYYVDRLKSGEIRSRTLTFELDGTWAAFGFAREYQLFINGLEVLVTDDSGLHRVSPGPTDIALISADGASTTARLSLDDDHSEIFSPRDTAHAWARDTLAPQLKESGNACKAVLDETTLDYIGTFAEQHPNAELWIALDKSKSPWRFEDGQLIRPNCD